MKKIILLLLFFYSTINAQDLEAKMMDHIESIIVAIPDLKTAWEEQETKYRKLAVEYDQAEKQYNFSNSYFEQAKLKVKLTYLKKRREQEYQKSFRMKRDLVFYYGLLAAQQKISLSPQELKNERKFAPVLNEYLKEAEANLAQAVTDEKNARKRLAQIDVEQAESEEELGSIRRRLTVLEKTKVWGNLQERLSLKSQIGFHQGKIVKLKGERVYQDNALSNALEEQTSYELLIPELKIAIRFWNNQK